MGDFSTEKLFLFVLFALPGAIAIRVYTLWCPVPQKDWKESVFDAVLYSSVGLAVWLLIAPDVIRRFVSEVIQQDGPAFNSQAVSTVVANRLNLILFILATPAVLSSGWYWLRLRLFHHWFGFDHPTRTAWDWVFSRKQAVYILFFMKSKDKDGKQLILVGYFNGRSFVTSYPLDAEIYVERVHTLTPEGKVGMPIPGSNGMLIKVSECEHLEFLLDPTPVPLSLRQRVWVRTKSLSRRAVVGCWSGAKGTPRFVTGNVVKGSKWTWRQLATRFQRVKTWRTRATEASGGAAGRNPSTTDEPGQF